MQIIKYLALDWRSFDVPTLASPVLRGQKQCSTCGVAYSPLVYVVPGVVTAQHWHPEKGEYSGIFCRPVRPGLTGPDSARWRALGQTGGDWRENHLNVVYAQSVQLHTLQILCAVCAVWKPADNGALVTSVIHEGPVPFWQYVFCRDCKELELERLALEPFGHRLYPVRADGAGFRLGRPRAVALE